jgi:hypothetical protein
MSEPTIRRPLSVIVPSLPITAPEIGLKGSLGGKQRIIWTCGRNNTVNGERLEYFLRVSAGIGGEPLRQQRAPEVPLTQRFRGSHNFPIHVELRG